MRPVAFSPFSRMNYCRSDGKSGHETDSGSGSSDRGVRFRAPFYLPNVGYKERDQLHLISQRLLPTRAVRLRLEAALTSLN